MNLPSGTLTFLFTDIEGSTKLWERCPEAMRLALARHDTLLREAIERHNGHVFKTVGDAFCAAFPTAPDALTAAVEAHLALLGQEWGETGSLRVRMGLHTGVAEERDNDYFGPTLNRVARLQSVGHGQQTLLSQATYELVKGQVSADITLSDLGQHRLKDLLAPEHVWQLLHPALPAQFPPLKSLDHLPNNLPRQMTSFIGRDKEMQAVTHLLHTAPLLTLSGSGGTGKTRLLLQVGAEVLDAYPDGVWLVEFAPLADPALVPQAVASVLNVREEVGKPLMQTLAETLQPKKLLLLLDNCEHVLEAAATLADTLLKTCPEMKILASSRESLGVLGEQTYRIPSLSLPPSSATLLPASMGEAKAATAELLHYEAVRLFVERAALVKADFTLTSLNASAVVQICVRLDGIPLAIELAASRVRALPVEQIEARLHDRFRLLTGGSRTALPRQQTLRALIDWSYDLLNAQEKALLLRLSVFAGGWTLEAAEQVCAGEGIEAWEVLEVLTALVDKSLVGYEEQEGQARYHLLETIRQYARDRMVESAEADTWRVAHRDYFLQLAEEAQQKLRGAEQVQWLKRLETEHDNLRAALDFCLDAPDGAEAGLRLGGALQQFWWTRGHLSEGRQRLIALLSRSEAQEHTQPRATALKGAGVLAEMQGDFTAARSLYEGSLALYRELKDTQGIAASLGSLGNVTNDEGDFATARSLYEESLSLYRELGDTQGIAASLGNLGVMAFQQGDYVAAYTLYTECLALVRKRGDKRSMSASLGNLGTVANQQGDYAAAHLLHEEALKIDRELGDKYGIAFSLYSLALLYGKEGDNLAVQSCLGECLTLCRELGDTQVIAYALEGYAQLAHRQQQSERAMRLYGAAHSLRESIGAPVPPNVREEHEHAVASIREALGQEAFKAAWTEGQAMSWEQAVVYALNEGTMA